MSEAFDDLQTFIKVCASEVALLEALEEIAKGEGRFSADPLKHAENTIQDMKSIADNAIAKQKGGA